MKCSSCNKEISEEEEYFQGSWCPPRISHKFGCSPHVYYCKKCCDHLPNICNKFRLPLSNNMEWIGVEEELPEPDKGSIYSRAVLATNIDDTCIFVATYVKTKNSWNDYYSAPYGNIDPITHWMELPEAPKD